MQVVSACDLCNAHISSNASLNFFHPYFTLSKNGGGVQPNYGMRRRVWNPAIMYNIIFGWSLRSFCEMLLKSETTSDGNFFWKFNKNIRYTQLHNCSKAMSGPLLPSLTCIIILGKNEKGIRRIQWYSWTTCHAEVNWPSVGNSPTYISGSWAGFQQCGTVLDKNQEQIIRWHFGLFGIYEI